MSQNRLNILPSRTNFVLMKQRIIAAQRGLYLLKGKRDALELKLREIKKKLAEDQDTLNEKVLEALFSTSRAKYMGTDFKPASVMNVDRADVYLTRRDIKVVGVDLPTYQLIMKPYTSFPFTGLANGGAQVEIMREKFRDALRALVTVASLEYSMRKLQQALHTTNMRTNALAHVVIPRFQNTVAFIADCLDESDREDFFRIKLSQAKQKKNKDKNKAPQPKQDEPEEIEETVETKVYTDVDPNVDIRICTCNQMMAQFLTRLKKDSNV